MPNYSVSTRKKNKGWQVIISYKDMDGNWRQKSKQGFPTKMLAKDYAPILLEEVEKEQLLTSDTELREITLSDLYKLFIQYKSHSLRPNSLITYQAIYKNIEPLHAMQIKAIAPHHIRKLLDECGKAPPTQVLMLRFINSMFKYAIDEKGIVSSNPVRGIKVIGLKNSRIKIITDDELTTALNSISTHHIERYALKLLMKVLSATGMRRGEVLGLTWESVNWLDCSLSITKQLTKDKDGKYSLVPPKTTNSIRTIPIPPQLRDELLAYSANPLDEDRLFPISHPDTLTRLINTYLPSHSPHDFRHTYATKLLANNVDVKTVASLLGDTVNTVINTYIHYSDEMRANASGKISEIFKF